jgi:4-hydroxybenzoyl-CoA thioesterase
VPFARDIPVRFPDVDYARVVYYPRFFDYSHRVFEDFFAAEVGLPYADMLQKRNLGFPSVSAKADFQHPLRFGDLAHIEMDTVAVGNSAITCRYRFSRSGTPCAQLEIVTATIDLTRFVGAPVPDDVRSAFERFLIHR